MRMDELYLLHNFHFPTLISISTRGDKVSTKWKKWKTLVQMTVFPKIIFQNEKNPIGKDSPFNLLSFETKHDLFKPKLDLLLFFPF